VKLATDQKYGHFEVKCLVRFFRDRLLTPTTAATTTAAPVLSNAGTNNKTEGGGFGFAAAIPVTKKVDFFVNSLAGYGIGRYLSSNTADVTLSGSGVGCAATLSVPDTTHCSNKLLGIRSAGAMGGFEIHPTPKFDFNMYYGLEYYQRTNGTAGYVGNGYGDSGAAVPTVNAGDNKSINQVMVTPVYRFYRGPYGTFQAMLNLQYSLRTVWATSVSTTGKCTGLYSAFDACTAKGGEAVGVFALRYILP